MIIGFGKRTFEVKGQTKKQKCLKCSHERPFKVVEEKTWFTFFFIPVFPFKKRKLLVCSVCGAGYETKEQVTYEKLPDQATIMKTKESAYEKIKEQFDKGEISKNEFIRMTNILKMDM
ncbi:MAG: zinc ribbon domain-containing protein [Clostridia bacterium]|nr:zinc ribbon domain-containing protein [Clostridia bacterium]